MMNQPLRRVDPLGRSAAPIETRPTAPRAGANDWIRLADLPWIHEGDR
jgi:hypothetical protein